MPLPQFLMSTRKAIAPAVVDDLVGGPPIRINNFRMEDQERGFWCWAAVAASIKHTYFPGATNPWRQCHVAQQVFGAACCNNADCNQMVSLALALQKTNGLLRNGGMFQGALDIQFVRNDLAAGHPVAYAISWEGGGGHAVVVYASFDYAPNGISIPYVEVEDPFPSQGWSRMSYSDFVQRYRSQFPNNAVGFGQVSFTYLTQPGT